MSRRIQLSIILCLALLIIALRLALPTIVQRYVNRSLNRIPDYQGSIGDVDISLYRGAYKVHDVRLDKKTGQVAVPFFAAGLADLSVQWSGLLRGRLVGEIVLERAQLNLVDAPSEEASQKTVDSIWLQAVKDLFPFDINRFIVRDSNLHFRNFQSSPQVDVSIDQLAIQGTNLSNIEPQPGQQKDKRKNLPAVISAQGVVQQSSPVRVEVHLDPLAETPTFRIDASVRELQLAALNSLFRAYGNFDAEGGRLSIFVEADAAEGSIEGYVKPILNDVKILSIKEDKGMLNKLWQGAVDGVTKIFRNQPRRELATRIPIAGKIDQPEVGTWAAILNILRNAFVKAYEAGFEGEEGN